MDQTAALRVAIDLMQVPSRVRAFRDEPLPAGMDLLLRVAAGQEDAIGEAEIQLGRPGEVLRDAATFFVEQILLAPHTDSYRTLGATREAATAELRRNMTLLLRWLHPDVAADRDRSVFATRVAAAWDSLKTDDRRSVYDEGLSSAVTTPAMRQRSRHHPTGQRLGRSRHQPASSQTALTREHAVKMRPGLMRRLVRLLTRA